MNFKLGLKARIKMLLPNWLVKVEFCEKCGVTQTLPWTCDSDELWKQVSGNANSVLCPACFWQLAWEQNLFIMFHATTDFTRPDKQSDWVPTSITSGESPNAAECQDS